MHSRSAHVLGGVGWDAAVDVGEAVVAAHRRQPPVNRRRRQPTFVHPRPVQLDVRARRRQRRHVDVVAPLEELAQVRSIRLQGAAAVAGQERHRRQLALIEQRPISSDDQRSQRRRVEHGHDNLPTGCGGRPASPTPQVLPDCRRSRARLDAIAGRDCRMAVPGRRSDHNRRGGRRPPELPSVR